MNFSDFKPALRFLLIFLSVYFVLNLLYGIWIEALGTRPDVVTHWVSSQSAAIVRTLGWEAQAVPNPDGPTIRMVSGDRVILNVFEGCNGLNVIIVFLAFVLAFGGSFKKMLWFIPLGVLVIHSFNLFRILLLYFLASNNSTYFYYFHKYFFTAVIYLAVFFLWWLWIILNHGKRESADKD
ncbi:MAG: exosortase family protein XrtF [Cyclobacteriaceae bacterium]|nr:exosortase family protein XrtF [Cyclobacteriaceae bacterium]